ncbi:MAG: penicillin-binding protein 1C, partial [bacterium]|nr:penicillin-binding protein 1C [bacterium]
KLIQIIRALQLTRHYNKPEILETYFNLAPYGRNIEGIETASLIYFNKHAAALSLPEALTLSVIPQNPSQRNPTSEKGFSELIKARENLFHRWIENHKEDENKQVFLELPLAVRAPEQLPFRAPHFINDLDRQLPWSQRGRIKTTLDWNQQTAIQSIVSGYVERRKSDGIKNAVAMLIHYQTMEVRALVGSVNFFDPFIDGQVNGTTAKRSPGSALKPFVYAVAMDQGLIHPMTLLKDAPRRFAGFTPENFDQRFMGPVFAKDALTTSRNVPAVYLQAQLSKPNFYNFLQRAGIRRLKQESFYGLALALGGVEVTMEELVSLYAMLPNSGILRPIKKLSNAPYADNDIRLLSPESSFLLLDILKDNPQPLGTRLAGQVYDANEVAWKTGTSFAFRDAWAVGISGSYVLAVWVGNFQGDGNSNFIGRQAAGPLLFEIFSAISHEKNWHVTDAIRPGLLNLKKVTVCAKTGDLPVRYCPNTIESWFIPGVSPIKVSTIHRAIPIDKETGLRSCWFDPPNSEMKIYEFWPSDLLHIFQMAGISLKVPPQYKDDCSLNEKSASGQTPVIRSPQATITYALQSHRLEQERIPFSAVVDADVKTLYWFVGNRFVGKA